MSFIYVYFFYFAPFEIQLHHQKNNFYMWTLAQGDSHPGALGAGAKDGGALTI
jgi:hypothetical protein